MAWPLDRVLLRGLTLGFLRVLRLFRTVVFPKARMLCLILLHAAQAHAHVINVAIHET